MAKKMKYEAFADMIANNNKIAETPEKVSGFESWSSVTVPKMQSETPAPTAEPAEGTAPGTSSIPEAEQTYLQNNGVQTDYGKLAVDYGASEAKAQADANAERAKAEYGVRAENLGQRGISGGYGDWIDASAYAAAQNQKQAIDTASKAAFDQQLQAGRQSYAQWADANRVAEEQKQTAAEQAQSQLNTIVSGAYTDEDGNTQGYNLGDLSIDDATYSAYKDRIALDLKGNGWTNDQINAAFAFTDEKRAANRKADSDLKRSYFTTLISPDGTVDQFLANMGVDTTDMTDASKEESVYASVDQMAKNGVITKEEQSKFYRDSLHLNDDSYASKGWRAQAKNLNEEVTYAGKLATEGKMTWADYSAVVDEAYNKLNVTKIEVKGRESGTDILVSGSVAGKKFTVRADWTKYSVGEGTVEYLNATYPTTPLVSMDGKLYLQREEGKWDQIDAKYEPKIGGETRDDIEEKNNVLHIVAKYMTNRGGYDIPQGAGGGVNYTNK